MEQYEIHIVRDGKAVRVHACSQVSDHAAVRRAQALTENRLGIDQGFEVWRGGACVYSRPQGGPHAIV